MKRLKKGDKEDKVGIITFFYKNYNFGGLLQAYALPKVLKEYFGIDSEQINFIPSSSIKSLKQNNCDKKNIFCYFYQIIYEIGIVICRILFKKKLYQRKCMFDGFMNEIPHSQEAYNYDSIHETVPLYSKFLCGGDQIWNDSMENNNIKIYTLQFVPSSIIKSSYAPSMAVLETTSDYEKIMRNSLSEMHAISVREKKSLPILESLTNKKIEVVVDPVLLMTENEWIKFGKDSKKRDPYILGYLLGDNMGYRKEIKHFSKKIHLPVLTFPHIFLNVVRKCDLFFGDIHDYSSGPREFIELIKNAEFVITDSFHACVFSMIFKTPFVVFERSRLSEKGNMNSRIYDFLEEYHLEDQLVTESELRKMNEIPQIDFSFAHRHWKKRRKESFEYLEKALKDK